MRPPQVASSWGGGPTTLWRLGAPPVRTLKGHGLVVDLKFFPSGSRLVTASADGSGAIWDAASGRELRSFLHGYAGRTLFEVQVFPGGDRFVTLGSDLNAIVAGSPSAIVWSLKAEVLQRLGHQAARAGEHRAVRVFPQGERLLTGVSDGPEDFAVVWHAHGEGSALHRLRQPGRSIRALGVSPCGAKVVTAGAGAIFVWDAAAGFLEREIHAQAWLPAGVVVSRAAAAVAVSSPDRGSVLIWDPLGNLSRSLPARGVVALGALAGDQLIVSGNAGVTLWDAASGQRLADLSASGGLLQVAGSLDGDVVAACSGARDVDQRTVVWDASTGRVLRVIRGQAQPAPQHLHGVSIPPCRVAVSSRPRF